MLYGSVYLPSAWATSSGPAWRSPSLPIAIGISSCLLGEAVRYDGGHKKDKDRLTAGEKRELLGLIADYAGGVPPLVVPITLINHYVARFEVAYVAGQVYLRPDPKELMLATTSSALPPEPGVAADGVESVSAMSRASRRGRRRRRAARGRGDR